MSMGLPSIAVLFADEDVLAVNKPAGITVTHDGTREESPTLAERLHQSYGDLLPVHRLDRDTSGVVVLARHPDAHRALNQLFETHAVEKVYHLIVVGTPDWEERQVEAPLLPDGDRRHRTIVDAEAGKPSLTTFRVLQRFQRHALLEARPLTGRTHQVRVHAALVGLPIVADPLYGDGAPLLLSSLKRSYRAGEEPERPLIGRLALHAQRLAFPHPRTEKLLEILAPYPKDFRAALNQLAKHARLSPAHW